jgi:uridine kinase
VRLWNTDHVITPVVDRLQRAPARATRVLAIEGRSGSGKTSLATALSSALGSAPIVHVDDLYPGWDGLAASIPRLVDGVLRPLAEGRPMSYRRYDWERSEDADRVVVPDPVVPTLIVEGIGAGARPCAPYLSVLVWLDAPDNVRFERAMTRDGDTYRPHWQRWADQEERYLADHDPRGRADVRLNTQDPGVT